MNPNDLQREFKIFALSEKGMMPKGYLAIQNAVQKLFLFHQTHSIKQIDQTMVRQFLIHFRQTKLWSAKTYRNYWQHFKTYFDWCVKAGYIKRNPVVGIERPKLPSIQPRCLTPKEARNVLLASATYSWGNTFQNLRNQTIIWTFMMTGIRLQELLNLQVQDVQWSHQTIFIRQGKGRKDRSVPIYPKLNNCLAKYFSESKRKKNRFSWLFTGLYSDSPLCPRDIHKICKTVGQAAQVKFTPHMLRHTFARELCDDDFDIMKLKEILGHAHVTTTQRYVALSQRRIMESFQHSQIYRDNDLTNTY